MGITFTSQNSQPVSPVLFSYVLPQLQLGLWILLVLLLGACLGLVLSGVSLLWGKQSIFVKERKIKQLQKELNGLRTVVLKE
ncbi:MAG: DUF1049 domain-containing protein [Cellvibrionaceae bacterium]|nr:DUF1049 domain-containing protein [Cellvibrionaceae bacterium]